MGVATGGLGFLVDVGILSEGGLAVLGTTADVTSGGATIISTAATMSVAATIEGASSFADGLSHPVPPYECTYDLGLRFRPAGK